jgi:hypothetical protein
LTGAAAGLAATIVITTATDPLAQAATASTAASYQTRPLGLDPKAIKGLLEQIITSHYANN